MNVADEEIPFLDEGQIDKGLFGNHEAHPREESSGINLVDAKQSPNDVTSDSSSAK